MLSCAETGTRSDSLSISVDSASLLSVVTTSRDEEAASDNSSCTAAVVGSGEMPMP